MSPRRTWAVARKEFLHVLRDPRSLGIALGIPVILIFLYGYALTLDVDRVPLVVWDQSQTPHSREMISRFEASRYFTVHAHIENYRELEDAIDSGRALAGLVLPVDFGRELAAGREVAAQFIVDGSDSNTATIALGYAEVVTQGYSQDARLQQVRKITGQPLRPPLEVRARVWFNEELKSKNYIIPGLIAVIMMVIAALLTSLTVAREWEQGTMEQLISTPVTGGELVLGKLAPYFVLGMTDVAIAVVMGVLLFDVPLRGNVFLLFSSAGVFLVGALTLGMVVSIVAKSQMLASQTAIIITFLPSFLLSGFIFAIANIPTVLQWVTYLVPATYFITLLKGIFLKGIGPEILWMEGITMIAFAVAMLTLANLKFEKKLEG